MTRALQLPLVLVLSCARTDLIVHDPGIQVAADIDIGAWDDQPGSCPDGTERFDVDSLADLEDATRGVNAFAGTGAGSCIFVHDGTYDQGAGLPVYFLRGGSADQPIYLVGESRDGVVIRGRGGVEADHIVVENVTFDLTGFSQVGSFSTFTILGAADVRLSHVTFTGDCATGLDGGHVEVYGGAQVVIDSCIVEAFGQCSGDGHDAHGVLLAAGSDILVRNNVIRGNSSRGIQLFTNGGAYGTLAGVAIERNRVSGNGHRDFEDGLALGATGSGVIEDVRVEHNIFDGNYFSGIRFSGPATDAIVVEANTFFHNGEASAHAARAEITIDEAGMAANAEISRNIVVAARALLNDCYDAASMSFAVDDNIVFGGDLSLGGDGCIANVVSLDPRLADPRAGDFRPQAVEASGYGAYAH